MRFRKRPVEIEAIQFLGTISSVERLLAFIGNHAATTHVPGIGYVICVTTTEGEMRANPGDWIIKEIEGEFLVCKRKVFEATYELAGVA